MQSAQFVITVICCLVSAVGMVFSILGFIQGQKQALKGGEKSNADRTKK